MFEPAFVTAEDLASFTSDEYRYELVAGRVVRMSPVGFTHGRVVIQCAALLGQHVRAHRLGVVVTEVGFKLASNPDTVRAPDLAFIVQRRIPSPEPRGFWSGAPDLVIEVLSPEDRAPDMRAKVLEYLASGTPAVAVIDPDREAVAVHRPARPTAVLRSCDLLDLADVVPGFSCSVQDLFA
jgi:Uma2 family endonuclease